MTDPTIGELLEIYRDSDPRHDLILTMGHLTLENSVEPRQLLEFCLRQHLRTFLWLQANDQAVVNGLVRAEVHAHGSRLGLKQHVSKGGLELEEPQLTLGFADRIWVTLSVWNKFHHVHTGDEIRHLGRAPLETTSVDLTALWYRHQERIKRGRSQLRQGVGAEATANPEAAGAASGTIPKTEGATRRR